MTTTPIMASSTNTQNAIVIFCRIVNLGLGFSSMECPLPNFMQVLDMIESQMFTENAHKMTLRNPKGSFRNCKDCQVFSVESAPVAGLVQMLPTVQLVYQ